MNKTLIAAALALGTLSAAHAGEAVQYSEANYPSDSFQSQPSTLTRAAVIADLVAARANGSLPQYGEDLGSNLAQGSSTLTREQVRSEAIRAARNHLQAQENTTY